MSVRYITCDLQRPSDNAETCFSLGYQHFAPTEIDTAGNASESASLTPASNTRGVFKRGNALYKLLNRQHAPFGTVICKSINQGGSWTLLDGANSPTSNAASGFYDAASSSVFCAFNSAVPAGNVNLITFNLVTEKWGAVFGVAGAPAVFGGESFTVWKRPDSTLLVLFDDRNSFNVGDPSGISAAAFNLDTGVWGAAFDVGANVIALPSWDSTQSLLTINRSSSVMDSTGIVHVFMNVTSLQLVPVIWSNRCFYQAIRLNNSLGSFFDFPGQVAPLTGGKQDLVAFSGAPLGIPVIVNNTIVLPVLNTNRGADPLPSQLANVYLGTPVSGPVWSKDVTKTIDPGAIVDDSIWPQEVPMLVFDGVSISATFGAAGTGGQVLYRVRLCQTLNLGSPSDSWAAQTILNVSDFPIFAAVPGQSVSTAGIGLGSDPNVYLAPYVVILPDPSKDC
jgi:hypothetical protein